MPENQSPLTHSIGLSGVLRWIIAAGAVIAIGAAFANHRYGLGVVALVFFVAATVFGYRAWRAH